MTEQEFYDRTYRTIRHPAFVIIALIFAWWLFLYGVSQLREHPLSLILAVTFGPLTLGYIIGATTERFIVKGEKLKGD